MAEHKRILDSLTSQLLDQEVFNISQISQPSQAIKNVMYAVMILLEHQESWISVAAKLRQYKTFLKKIKTIDSRQTTYVQYK